MTEDKKVILITGATKGIGKAISDKFEEKGDIVLKIGTSEQKIPNYYRADVSEIGDLIKLKQKISKKFHKIDVLINNAAYTKYIPYENVSEITPEIIDKILNVNIKGPFFCTQIFCDLIKKSKSGVIINIGSIAGLTGKGSNLIYSASKAALLNLTKSLAIALAPIRVNSISPGYIKTGFVKFPDAHIDNIIEKTLLKRKGTPEDVANIVFLILKSDFMTGENILIDGGLILS